MADPMKIRATMAGDKVEVRVLMSHEMETGQRKDAAGKTIPAWFIQEVNATHNGKPVFSALWGTSVAKNPYLKFNLKSRLWKFDLSRKRFRSKNLSSLKRYRSQHPPSNHP